LQALPISLKALIQSPKFIHISDLHFADFPYYLNSGGSIGVHLQKQDSPKRSAVMLNYLVQLKNTYGLKTVINTGDLTDSGDQGDYVSLAKPFNDQLTSAGFTVYSLPGNHDYCKEGTIQIDKVSTQYVEAILSLGGQKVVDEFTSDNASNNQRREWFIQYITGYSQYPHVVDFDNWRLILLDSMQGELDANTGDWEAQGLLGDAQLLGSPGRSGLRQYVDEYQQKRVNNGNKLVVCLHHSPYSQDDAGLLTDAVKFLESIGENEIDCLLFGHTTPDNCYQQPNPKYASPFDQLSVPLINCENLQNVPDDGSYPVTVIDLGSLQRIVFHTDQSTPARTWASPSFPFPELSAKITAKAGPATDRVWTVQFSNTGWAPFTSVQIDNIVFTQQSEGAGGPVIITTFPLSLGSLGAGGSVSVDIHLRFFGNSASLFAVQLSYTYSYKCASGVKGSNLGFNGQTQ
jgi:predicted MPP superfamily phosphohydrolase